MARPNPDFSTSAFDDPEGCYRRGYDQCAAFLLEEVSPLLPSAAAAELKVWKNEVERWRGQWREGRRGVPFPPKLGV
jgi:hypothetical protein